MSNKRQENADVCTSRLNFRLDCYDNRGEYTSFKVEAIGNATELDKLFTKTLSELQERIGSKEFPHIQLVRFTRSTDIVNTETSEESSDFLTTPMKL